MIKIDSILDSQGWNVERKSGTAYFYNHTPWVAPLAYLHIVFKGSSKSALKENSFLFQLPSYWTDFLSAQNGAMLFSCALSIYGAIDSKALLNRRDYFERQPFSIASENRSWPPKDKQRGVVIGGYSYDGTLAVLDKETGSVTAMSRKGYDILKVWSGVDVWIASEMDRLSNLFDKSGRITVDEERTLPRE